MGRGHDEARITRTGVDVSLFLAKEKAFSRSSVRAARFAGIGFPGGPGCVTGRGAALDSRP